MKRFKYWYLKQGSEEWNDLHKRKDFFTASQLPNICGYGYNSIKREWKWVMGIRDRDKDMESKKDILEKGHQMEPIAINFFLSKHPFLQGINPGLLIHPEREDFGASLDNILIDISNGELYPLEIKSKIMGKVPENKFEIKPRVIIQVMGQMATCGLDRAILFYYANERNYNTFYLRYCPEIMRYCFNKLDKFKYYIETKQQPPRNMKDLEFEKLLQNYINNHVE